MKNRSTGRGTSCSEQAGDGDVAEKEDEMSRSISLSEAMEESDAEDSEENGNSSDEDEMSKTRVTVKIWQQAQDDSGEEEVSDEEDYGGLDDDNVLLVSTVRLNKSIQKAAGTDAASDDPQGHHQACTAQSNADIGVIILERRDPFNRQSPIPSTLTLFALNKFSREDRHIQHNKSV
jgi:hypothetical protein